MFTRAITHTRLDENDVHKILSNPRRRETLRVMNQTTEAMTLRDLSELVATIESGEDPAPRNVRQAVYISLHQTHLPKLHSLGVLSYDADRKLIELREAARDVTIYMEVVTPHGITWSEYYRGLCVLGLVSVVGSLTNVPGLSLVDPLLWASGYLSIVAASTVYQLWNDRWRFLRSFSKGK